MIPLLRAESRNFITNRATAALALFAVAYGSLAVAVASTVPASERPDFDADSILMMIRGAGDLSRPALLVIGILLAAGEFRHGTIVPRLLVAQDRSRLLAAKLWFGGMLGAVVGAAAGLLTTLVGAVYLGHEGIDLAVLSSAVWQTNAAVVGVTALYGLIGVAIGFVVRNQTAAITGALVWLLVIEEALPLVLRLTQMRRWLPDNAASSVLARAQPDDERLGMWAAGLFLLILAAAAAAVARAVFVRIDLT